MVKICKIFQSVTLPKVVSPENQYNGGFQRFREYNRKSKRGLKMVYYYGAAMWDMAQEGECYMYFVTLTTRQHFKDFFPLNITVPGDVLCTCKHRGVFARPQSRLIGKEAVYFDERNSDQFYYDQLKKFFRGKKYSYICCAERQRNTQDLHLHLLVRTRRKLFSDFDSKSKHCAEQVAELAKLFCIPKHDSIYDVKEISDFKGVVSYCSKCFGNHNKKSKQKFSSLFYCRTFSASRDVAKYYKENASRYHRGISSGDLVRFTKGNLGFNGGFSHITPLKLKKSLQFFSVFEFSNELWEMAGIRHS